MMELSKKKIIIINVVLLTVIVLAAAYILMQSGSTRFSSGTLTTDNLPRLHLESSLPNQDAAGVTVVSVNDEVIEYRSANGEIAEIDLESIDRYSLTDDEGAMVQVNDLEFLDVRPGNLINILVDGEHSRLVKYTTTEHVLQVLEEYL